MADDHSHEVSSGAAEEKVNPIVQYFRDFKVLKETKREYWGLQVINALDCLAYFGMLNIATVTLSNDFGFTDEWAGYAFTIFSGLTTIFLFFSGVITDWLGIKRALYIAIIGLLALRAGIVATQYMDEPVRMDDATELATLYDGEGIPSVEGQPDLSITARNGQTFDVDLFGARTIGEVIERINSAAGPNGGIEASISPGWVSLRLKDRSEAEYLGPIVVSATPANPQAAKLLGLETSGEYSGTLDGSRVISNLNSVNVSDLNQGRGLKGGDELVIRDSWGTQVTITGLADLETLKQLRTHIETSVKAADVRVALDYNTAGNGFRVSDRNSRRPIDDNTPLADLHGGKGVLAAGGSASARLRISALDGSEFDIDLSGCVTLGEVFQRVDEGTRGHILLRLLDGQKIVVQDASPPAAGTAKQSKLTLAGGDEGGTLAARRMGILKERGTTASSYVGSAIPNPRWEPPVSTRVGLVARINGAAGNYGKVVASLDGEGRLVLADASGGTDPLVVTDPVPGGGIATDIGIVQTSISDKITGSVPPGTDAAWRLFAEGPELSVTARDGSAFTVELGNLLPLHGIGVSGRAAGSLGIAGEGGASISGEDIVENKVRSILVIVLLACMAPFMAMIQTIFQAGNRRFTTNRSRGAGFNLWYLFMNVGAMGGGYVIDIIYLRMGLPHFHVFTLGIFTGVLCLVANVLFIKNTSQLRSPDDAGQPPSPAPGDADLGGEEKKGLGPLEITKAVLSSPVFWRFTALVTLLLGVRAVFLYLALLFPKFWYRVIGPDAQVGFLQSLNPIFVIVGLMVMIPVLQKFNVYKMLVFGALITSVSMFIPALPPFSGMGIVSWTYVTTGIFLFVLTIGELIWSPRLQEYTAAIAPEGQEGTYLGLTMVPYFAAKLFVSALSGSMLSRWCPEYPPGEPNIGERIAAGEVAFVDSPYLMWLILGGVALFGTLVAILAKGWFTKGAHFSNEQTAGAH
ncbi:MAG: MFS transporter [Planctomycetota bacterium]